ncbi:hypothetical protein LUZ60_013990 [Juncus effusus]|nr:hypothetical protein LUZ60_013990 [Juncus effusus]
MGHEEEDNHTLPTQQYPTKPTCDFCSAAPPVIFCRADSARLCLGCDRQVHAANTVSSRHSRSILCDTCHSSASTFFCSSPSCNSFLCSNCDFDLHGNGDMGFEHERRGVEGYVGCPNGAELATALGVRIDEKGGEEGFRVMEMEKEKEKVFRLEDLIVPTTACHGFHPLQTPPLPKRNSYCGKYKDEILHQLKELIKSESSMNSNSVEDLEPISNLFSWDSSYSQFQGNYNPDANFDSASVMVPNNEERKWNPNDSYVTNNNFQNMEVSQDQYLVSSPDANMMNFVEMNEICPSENYENNMKEGELKETIHVLPVKNGPDFVCPDRDSVISRYKEKRKTRRYDKLVRYESRKVRADGRLRIKGRFAKGDQANKN